MQNAIEESKEWPLARLQKFLQQDPSNRHLLGEVIDLQVNTNRLADASILVEQALALYPDDPEFQFRKATIALAESSLS